jgi:hypothetical protein
LELNNVRFVTTLVLNVQPLQLTARLVYRAEFSTTISVFVSLNSMKANLRHVLLASIRVGFVPMRRLAPLVMRINSGFLMSIMSGVSV